MKKIRPMKPFIFHNSNRPQGGAFLTRELTLRSLHSDTLLDIVNILSKLKRKQVRAIKTTKIHDPLEKLRTYRTLFKTIKETQAKLSHTFKKQLLLRLFEKSIEEAYLYSWPSTRIGGGMWQMERQLLSKIFQNYNCAREVIGLNAKSSIRRVCIQSLSKLTIMQECAIGGQQNCMKQPWLQTS